MSINKIIGVKRKRKKGRHSRKGAAVGALPTVCISLTMRGSAKRVPSAIFFPL